MPNGIVIVFMCNHCPYLKAIIHKLVKLNNDLKEIGVGFVGINSNDSEEYPDGSFERMRDFAQQHYINFYYLWDSTQEVAKKYEAVYTPDFFGYNKDGILSYKGRLDSSHKEDVSNAKRELFEAMVEVSQIVKFTGTQIQSIGCSIKGKK